MLSATPFAEEHVVRHTDHLCNGPMEGQAWVHANSVVGCPLPSVCQLPPRAQDRWSVRFVVLVVFGLAFMTFPVELVFQFSRTSVEAKIGSTEKVDTHNVA